jgi:hypothetical protein
MISTIIVCLLLGAPAALPEASQDVTFSTKYASGRPTTASFYYNGRAIGVGREAFRVHPAEARAASSDIIVKLSD